MPVIDDTGLSGRYDLEFKWPEDPVNPDPEVLKPALLDQLGLELTPAIQTIEVLVVEKAKINCPLLAGCGQGVS